MYEFEDDNSSASRSIARDDENVHALMGGKFADAY